MKHLYRASTLALLLLLSCALAVNAAAPAEPEPGQAPYIDDQLHTLAAHDSIWYRFEFAVMGPGFLCHFFSCPDIQNGHGAATIRMPTVARSGIGFEVYAPAQAADWRKEDPVGRGNPDGEDLVWAGSADTNGTWYVRVVNPMAYPIDYHFVVAGTSLVVSRPAVDPATQQAPDVAAWLDAQRAPKPVPTAYPDGVNLNPGGAVEIDSMTHTAPPGTSLWFTFTFVTDTRLTVRLVNGAGRGLSLEVYSQGQIVDWWKEDPLGRGETIGSDLAWTGDPNGSRLRYVRVVNPTGSALDFQLIVGEAQPKAPAPLPFQGY